MKPPFPPLIDFKMSKPKTILLPDKLDGVSLKKALLWVEAVAVHMSRGGKIKRFTPSPGSQVKILFRL